MPFKKGHRGRGRGSRLSQGTPRTPTPKIEVENDGSDEEMQDGDADVDVTRDITPRDEPDEEDEDDAATPAQDEDEDGESDTAPVITTIPRRRRGRGGMRTSARFADHTPEPGDDASEGGTPYGRRTRGRGRGSGRGGFRGRRKGQREVDIPHVTDRHGTRIPVANDEAQIDQDDEGDDKVDEDGNLLGGREYRVRTFKIIGRGDRLYMLSTEPARCCGFRDSYLFFTKHPKLYKVLISEPEKKDLIDRDILPSSYKGRNIGVVTARSVFREFGARIIVGGRRITDDYKVQEVREEGAEEGELADPNDMIPTGQGEEYNRNRYVAWFGASDVYRASGPTGTGGPAAKPGAHTKRRNNLSYTNWQFVHAREASRFNTSLAAMRRHNLDGVYDSHTNMMFYPTIMQPTHAKWEQIPPPTPASPSAERKQLTNRLMNGPLTNGHSDPLINHHDSTMNGIEELERIQQSQPTIFSDVPAIVSRNFAVIDTVYKAPPISNTGYPGPDDLITDPFSGTTGLSNIAPELIDELPDHCKAAFLEAKEAELSWKRQWGTEKDVGKRGDLKIGFAGYPV